MVDLDADEEAALKKYKFGKQVVYETPKGEAATDALRSASTIGGIGRGITSTIAAKVLNHIWTVNDLVNGKEVTCKDITEMLAAEEQIREACQNLARILFVCRHFDGEEIIDIAPFTPNELPLAA